MLTPDTAAALVDEAAACGVVGIVNAATDEKTCETVVRQCRQWPLVSGAVGITPFEAGSLSPQWRETVESACGNAGVVAVGEIGIDASNPSYPPMDLQLPLFDAQLAVAAVRGLPVIVHSRGAETEAVRRCRQAGVARALFHCFTGGRRELGAILDSGYIVSFSGILTFKNAPLAAVAAYAPADRVLVETDTPFLAPVPHRGQANRPSWVGLTGERLAAVLGMDPAELAARMERTFAELFGVGPAVGGTACDRGKK